MKLTSPAADAVGIAWAIEPVAMIGAINVSLPHNIIADLRICDLSLLG
jgi:hypothetical protein